MKRALIVACLLGGTCLSTSVQAGKKDCVCPPVTAAGTVCATAPVGLAANGVCATVQPSADVVTRVTVDYRNEPLSLQTEYINQREQLHLALTARDKAREEAAAAAKTTDETRGLLAEMQKKLDAAEKARVELTAQLEQTKAAAAKQQADAAKQLADANNQIKKAKEATATAEKVAKQLASEKEALAGDKAKAVSELTAVSEQHKKAGEEIALLKQKLKDAEKPTPPKSDDNSPKEGTLSNKEDQPADADKPKNSDAPKSDTPPKPKENNDQSLAGSST